MFELEAKKLRARPLYQIRISKMPIRYEIRHLRHFIAVAEELNFSVAAEKSNIAQPALSRSIKQLEDLLGLQLLVRTSRHVKMTNQGRTFLRGAYKALELLQETHDKAQMVSQGEAGHLRIGYTNFAIVGRLPSLLNSFRNTYPNIKVDIIHNFTARQIEDVKDRKIDFGFITGPATDRDIKSLAVQKDRLVAIVSSRHPLAVLPSVQLKELMHEPFIMGLVKDWNYFHSHIQSICQRRGFLPNIVQEAYDSEGIFGFVEANMGITLHIESVRNNYRKGTEVVNLEDVEEMIPTDMIWLRQGETPVQRTFIEFVRRYSSMSDGGDLGDLAPRRHCGGSQIAVVGR